MQAAGQELASTARGVERTLAALATAALAILMAGEGRAAAQLIYASPDGAGGYFEGTFHAEAKALHVVLANLPRQRSEPLVIQLTTADSDPAAVTYYDRPVLIESRGSAQASLDIRGVRTGGRWLTRLRGPDLEATKCAPIQDDAARAACWAGKPFDESLTALPGDMLTAIGRTTLPLSAAEFRRADPGDRDGRLPCMSLVDSDHVVLKELGLESCWLAGVLLQDSQNVTADGNFILGSSYGLIVWNDTDDPGRARGYRITDNVWIQDVTGYGPDKGPACREPNATADCPGDMWRVWPWGATHDAEWEPYNGALFGGIGVGGDVLFAGNVVRNAYNGIRLYPARACRQGTTCLRQTQRNVAVIGNTFAFVRDNPIEPELHAADWHIAHNRFFNNHSWISTDGVAGGPVYVYGNIGWFSREIPGLACVEGLQWRDSLRFVWAGKREGGYVLAREAKPDYDPRCWTHRRGTVVKLGGAHGDPGPVFDALYIVHNSWLLRSPIFAGGYLGRVGYWNNAVLLAGCGRDGAEWCRTRPAIDEDDCPAMLPTYAADHGASLVADCFAFAAGAAALSSFDYDIGYPDLRQALMAFAGPTAEAEGRSADPMFADPWNGDFWPLPDSPLAGSACIVAWDGDALVCRPPEGDERANVGAVQPGGQLFALPPRPAADEG